MEYKYTPMRPQRTSMGQKFMRGVLALLLIGAAVLYFANPLHAQELDLTLPETPFNYEQMNQDSLLIQDAINTRLRLFNIKSEPTKRTLRTFYILNTIDMTSSYYMTRNRIPIKEANFLLPEKPSAAEFFIHKSVTAPLAAANLEEGQMVIANWILAAVILHNWYLYENSCNTTANYHHVTGKRINPC